MSTELIVGNWTYNSEITTIWCDGPESNYDPYTPNVIRNLKDKPQSIRDDRHYASGGVLRQCTARNCHNVVEADETLCKYHRGGLRAGYPIAILSSR